MARGPFQGTYQSGARPTVVTAPDALVYINGESDIIGCPSCKRRFDFNRYITSIQVDLNVDSPPGSANVTMSVPRHAIDDMMFEGTPVILPMMEVEIYAKGYYVVEGLPQYYPIFWGLVTEVNESYASGEHTVTLNCADILKWWELCKMNINPAFTQPKGQQGWSIFGNVFFGSNPYDLIWSLAQQAFGDVIMGTGSLVSIYKENGAQRSLFNNSLKDIMLYWNERFSRMRSNLLLYGTRGVAVRGSTLTEKYGHKNVTSAKADQHLVSSEVRKANGGVYGGQMAYDPTDPAVVAFRTQFSQAGQVNFWQSEYQTKLELANAAKEAIGFEFFMDVTGDIVFKPPFYNLDILSNKPVSWIQDIDIISWDFGESEAEVVTQIVLQGSYGGNVDYGLPEECTPFTSVTDYHLLRQYGWRSQTYNSEFLGDPTLMFYVGMDLLDRFNSKRHRGSVAIPLRPELRLGFPVYVAPKDQVWYVQGISHSIQFGGRAQTTLTLTAKRGKFIAPKGIAKLSMTSYTGDASSDGTYTSRQLSKGASFKLDYTDAAMVPPPPGAIEQASPTALSAYEPLILRHPKTGRIVGHPNVVMVYTRPFQVSPDNLGQRSKANRLPPAKRQETEENLKAAQKETESQLGNNKDSEMDDTYMAYRYMYGITSAGAYVYAHDSGRPGGDNKGVIQEFLLISNKRIQSTPTTNASIFEGSSGMIRPVSDERGFEVIGHFRYGRGVSLRDGSLVLTNGNNARASVDVQLALSGNLYDALIAQSAGLTTLTTPYQNPARAVAQLMPEDLQTAGMINPDTKEPQYVNTKDNFVDAAPIGSPEQKGLPISVEASQLSRALTLAEMTVRAGQYPGQESCSCLLSRSDLAFINVGYQVRTIPAAAGDSSGVPVGQGGVTNFGTYGWEAYSQTQDGNYGDERARREAQAAYDFDKEHGLLPEGATVDSYYSGSSADSSTGQTPAPPKSPDPFVPPDRPPPDPNVPAWLAEQQYQQTLLAAQDQYAAQVLQYREAQAAYVEAMQARTRADVDQYIQSEQQRVDAYEQTLYASSLAGDNPRPISEDALMTEEQVLARVDSYLFTLYNAHDVAHQQYERELRGQTIEGDNRTAQDLRFPTGANPTDANIRPPFSAPNRYSVGDPNADIAAARQAVDNLKEVYSNFGEDLNKATKRAQLQQEILNLSTELEKLLAQRASLDPPEHGVGVYPADVEAQIQALDAEIAKVSQQIADKQAELAQLG